MRLIDRCACKRGVALPPSTKKKKMQQSRFEMALEYINNHKDTLNLTQDIQLELYGLFKCATVGVAHVKVEHVCVCVLLCVLLNGDEIGTTTLDMGCGGKGQMERLDWFGGFKC